METKPPALIRHPHHSHFYSVRPPKRFLVGASSPAWALGLSTPVSTRQVHWLAGHDLPEVPKPPRAWKRDL